MISLKESILKSNKAGSDRFVFSLYKDAFPNPMISIGIDSVYPHYAEDVLDMNKVDKLYDKIPQEAIVESRDIKDMRRYLIHNSYRKNWVKLANVLLYCKNQKEIENIMNNVYTEGHHTKEEGKWSYPFHVETDINIGQGEKWTSISALDDHTRLKGTNSIKIKVYEDEDNPRSASFPMITFMIYMYDESQKKEMMFWK